MKAVVKTRLGAGYIEVLERAKPAPGPGEALVEVKVAGICGSDIHVARGEFDAWLRPPVIVGHEFAGVVADLGPGTNGVKIGTRVTAETSYHVCRACRYCQTGDYNLCVQRQILGYHVDGAFTRYLRVPVERLYPLPETIDFVAGALSEPLACAVHAVIEQTGVGAGELIVVLGPGPIGLLTAQVAKACGGRVMVVGLPTDETRLAMAQSLGMDWATSRSRDEIAGQVRELTDGLGADVIFECSGSEAGAQMGLEFVRKRGKYTQVGVFGRPVSLTLDQVWQKEITIRGSASQKRSAWQRALLLLESGMVRTAPLVSHTFPITDWDAALATAISGEGIKVTLVPTD